MTDHMDKQNNNEVKNPKGQGATLKEVLKGLLNKVKNLIHQKDETTKKDSITQNAPQEPIAPQVTPTAPVKEGARAVDSLNKRDNNQQSNGIGR